MPMRIAATGEAAHEGAMPSFIAVPRAPRTLSDSYSVTPGACSQRSPDAQTAAHRVSISRGAPSIHRKISTNGPTRVRRFSPDMASFGLRLRHGVCVRVVAA